MEISWNFVSPKKWEPCMFYFIFILGIYDNDDEIITLSKMDFGKCLISSLRNHLIWHRVWLKNCIDTKLIDNIHVTFLYVTTTHL